MHIPIGRVTLALDPGPALRGYVGRAWPTADRAADLSVRIGEHPGHFSVAVEGLPLPMVRATLRAAGWFARPAPSRPTTGWTAAARGEALVGDGRTWARLYARSLHLRRDAHLSETALDTAVALALAAQPERIFLHAATVADDRGALLITGVSGAGKTTLTMDLVSAGMALGGDELCGVDPEVGDAWPAPRAPIVRIGDRLPFQEPPPTERREVQEAARPWPEPRPLRALLFLEGYADRPSIRPVTTPEPGLLTALLDSAVVASSWGMEPARHALRIARLLPRFAALRTGALTLGSRPDTVEAVRAWWAAG